jgi:hypothetical protein
MERYWNEIADEWVCDAEEAPKEETGEAESLERENLVLLIASLQREC